ncbi:MAG: hypothetical protein QXW94_06795 [Desulfurococcaceae archaeon]
MIGLIDCAKLIMASNEAKEMGLELIELISIGLLLKEGLGRTAISKRLEYRERLVREAIDKLKSSDRIISLLGLLEDFNIVEINAAWLKCKPVFYGHFNPTLLKEIGNKVVALRDYLVIFSGDPNKVEIIGLLYDRELKYPGLPIELSEPYHNLVGLINGTNGVLLCWRNYRKYTDDSILLASLSSLCRLINI